MMGEGASNTESLPGSEGTTTTHWGQPCLHQGHAPCHCPGPMSAPQGRQSLPQQICSPVSVCLPTVLPCPATGSAEPGFPVCLSSWPAPVHGQPSRCPQPRAALLPGQGSGTGPVPGLHSPAPHLTRSQIKGAHQQLDKTGLRDNKGKESKTWYLMYLKGILQL